MKKVPSYPKITAKTNITVTQTQNININSPKSVALNPKLFKNDQHKIKDNQYNIRSNSSNHLLKEDHKKADLKRKTSKKLSKCDQQEK